MIRQPDALGNRVLDYSGVGYRGGTVPIPSVTVKTNISPVAGDDGASIQAAINYVASLPLDTNGFRGAVLLNAGEYQIANSITINTGGIVLSGVGEGSDTHSNTIIRAAGTGQRTLINVTGSGSPLTVSGTTHNITDPYVPVGARSFSVDNTNGLSVGAQVFVRRPSTANWIQILGMDQLEFPWAAGSFDLYFDRVIARVEGNVVTLDEPISCALDQQYGGGTIYRYTWSSRIANVGIESLRGISDFNPSVTTNAGASSSYYSDEDHGWTFIMFSNAVANAWVRNVTAQYFGYACVSISGNKYSGTRNITVRDCHSLDPVSIITGSRRYAFVLNDAQFCLIQNCDTHKDRHQFVTQSLTTGPNVFVDGICTNAYNDAGPHFQWGTGAIWDNIVVDGDNIDVQNRGNLGTAHGWAGANEVIWNSQAAGFIVQNPPTARNWLIGSVGTIESGTAYVGPHDDGTYDSHGTNVFPNSLYYAQLQDRLAAPHSQTREYWIGDIDQFATASPTGDVVTVDSAWRTAVQTAAGAAMLNGFDMVTNGQWVPFTFNYSLSATDRIVGATLALAMRSTSGTATDAVLHLDAIASSNSFPSLGWSTIATGTNTTVCVLDLGSQLSLLADGRLNVAIAGGVGIDWAMLELQVAPVQTLYTNSILPEADTYVRGGTNADLNYGGSSTLDVKADTSANTKRQAYLRWNLAGYLGNVVQARVRLTPTSVGTNGLEHGITLTTSNQWSENNLTWNNQPGGGRRFATWIPTANEPVEFVVTPQVQAALAGDGLLSLELSSLSYVGSPGLVSYASRENATAAVRPQLIITGINTAPTLGAMAGQLTPVNTPVGPLPITIADLETPASNLILTATSFDPRVVPVSNIVFGGSGSNRTVTITPAADYSGVTTLTMIVSDGSLTASNSFLFAVQATPIQSWRQTYFGTTANAGSAADTADVTGTGQNNLFKYIAGLDPTNRASIFTLRIASVTNQPAQKNLLFSPLATGRSYLPEFGTILRLDGWQPLNDFIGPLTNGDQVTITDSNAVQLQKFYRIRISLP